MDSFKGSMTSMEAGTAVREGILRARPEAEVLVKPLADGGEGTTEALVEGLAGKKVCVTVCGPLGEPVEAEYGILPDGTAVLEMAAAAGITLVDRSSLNPMRATTYGVGELIRDACNRGCRKILLGIGGSAATDGGAGMLQALGYELLDGTGEPITPGVGGVGTLVQISGERALPVLKECSFLVACDVNNPLCGERGAVSVFGPQKGVTPEQVPVLDGYLERFAELAAKENGRDCRDMAGAGAAGGLGFALLSFLNADLRPGISIVAEAVGLEEALKDADYVVTGEGRLDGQTSMGKAPAGVARLAKKYGIPVLAFAGCLTEDAGKNNQEGIDAFFAILPEILTLDDAMEPGRAQKNMARTVEQAFRLILTAERSPEH